jgi:hypothetical protein
MRTARAVRRHFFIIDPSFGRLSDRKQQGGILARNSVARNTLVVFIIGLYGRATYLLIGEPRGTTTQLYIKYP